MARKSEKPKPKSRKVKAAVSHEDDELPPERAAAQVKREAQLRQLVTGSIVEKIKKRPVS